MNRDASPTSAPHARAGAPATIVAGDPNDPHWIRIRGARTHNLQNVSLDLPRDRLIVITGLSGSGKSSLAFDTIYAEGRRKYVESLSAYARQFLGQIAKPDVDQITGLPPTIAIAQQAGRSNPRSTVATTTEVYDFLRLLFARVGTPHCPNCGNTVQRETVSQIVDAVLALSEQSRVMILAPLVRNRAANHAAVLERIQKEGFIRARIDGVLCELADAPPLDANEAHTIEAVVDRIVIKPDLRSRVAESIQAALRSAEGIVIISHQPPGGHAASPWTDETHTERYACIACGITLPELEPRLFSFNSPHGACPTCGGLGRVLEFDPALIAPEPALSLEEGAIVPWKRVGPRLAALYARAISEFCERMKVPPAMPFERIPPHARVILMNGTTHADEKKHKFRFEGVIPNLKRRWETTESDSLKSRLNAFLADSPCTACRGARLRPEALAIRVSGVNIHEVVRMNIEQAGAFFAGLSFNGEHERIAAPILRELRERLRFMFDVGVGYLTLNRTSATLSGGEAQRIRLATQIGSGLVGVCYVLDEPTIGLHERDTALLIDSLKRLTAAGNTTIVVEHDPAMIRTAEWIVDVGPGAGAHGGRILVSGDAAALSKSGESITAKYLGGELSIPTPKRRRTVMSERSLEIKGARENNLKNIDIRVPLGVFCCVTGVSGSGKSTLVNSILLRALRRKIHDARDLPGEHDQLLGVNFVDKVIDIDQSPIGRSSRSNPATYVGVFSRIRALFAATREAKVRGYNAARFSFNVKGGRCEACQGQGVRRIEMHFLPDVFVECAECRGTRYDRETLEIRYRGKSIADVLDMRVEEAVEFFDSFTMIRDVLSALVEVGLGYLTLGRPGDTLSGGESQRIKLAAELGKSPQGHTLYVLDEPTTGLHFADIHRLLAVLNRLCDAGHSIVVIEHNLDVIKQADWLIDLGPEGGDAGGQIVAQGTPEAVAKIPESHTGRYLLDVLRGGGSPAGSPAAAASPTGPAKSKPSRRPRGSGAKKP